MAGADENNHGERLVRIELDDATGARRSAEAEQERAIAIYDILEENKFGLPKPNRNAPSRSMTYWKKINLVCRTMLARFTCICGLKGGMCILIFAMQMTQKLPSFSWPWGRCGGLFAIIFISAIPIMMPFGQNRRRRFRRLIWGGALYIMKGQNCCRPGSMVK